jgi:prepilin-type N-terminal cleavage/methylation domain-containing protein
MKNIRQGFTLVELIVVVTIIGILGTIGFISYSRHLQGVRDTARVDQLKNLADAIDLSKLKGDLILPEEAITIRANGAIIGYQGKLGNGILQNIQVRDGGKDPKDGTPFSYYVSKDLKSFQLMAYQEETPQFFALFPTANAINYSQTYPVVKGAQLGILVELGTNIPVEQVDSLKAA